MSCWLRILAYIFSKSKNDSNKNAPIILQFPNTVSHFHLHGIINVVHQSEFGFWGYKNTMGMGHETVSEKVWKLR